MIGALSKFLPPTVGAALLPGVAKGFKALAAQAVHELPLEPICATMFLGGLLVAGVGVIGYMTNRGGMRVIADRTATFHSIAVIPQHGVLLALVTEVSGLAGTGIAQKTYLRMYSLILMAAVIRRET